MKSIILLFSLFLSVMFMAVPATADVTGGYEVEVLTLVYTADIVSPDEVTPANRDTNYRLSYAFYLDNSYQPVILVINRPRQAQALTVDNGGPKPVRAVPIAPT